MEVGNASGGCVAIMLIACAEPPGPIPPRDGPSWTDITASAGLDFAPAIPPDAASAPNGLDIQLGGGAVLADLDLDGHVDFLGLDRFAGVRLFAGGGDGTFEPVVAAGLEDVLVPGVAVAADLDGNRLRELLISDGSRLRVFRAVGAFTWEDHGVLWDAGFDGRIYGVSLADVDGDGFVDAYVSGYRGGPWGVQATPLEDRFFVGGPELAFSDRTDRFVPPGHLVGQGMGSVFWDADRDGQLDIYSIRDRGMQTGPNRLFLRRGETFVSDQAFDELDLAILSMGITVGDIDGDDRAEFAISDGERRLHVITVREDRAVDRGSAWLPTLRDDQVDSWGLLLRDFDHDGHDELVVPFGAIDPLRLETIDQRPGFYRWDGSRLVDATDELPLPALRWWRSAVSADLDDDGGLDLVLTQLFGTPAVLRGAVPDGAYVEIELDGAGANRNGLGARVEVAFDDRVRDAVVSAADGYGSSLDPLVRVGIGGAESADVTVRWPAGSTTFVPAVAPGRRTVIAEVASR
jgi:hypothetical protein